MPEIIYFVFAGDRYYPKEGFGDLKETTTDKDEALRMAARFAHTSDWTIVYAFNMETREYDELTQSRSELYGG